MRQPFIPALLLLLPALLLSCEKQDDTALNPETLDTWISYKAGSGLAHNTVWAIRTDDEGNLWFGTEGGVSRYNGQSWKSYHTGDGLINDIVYAVEQDRFGDLWFGTEEGISIFDGSSFYNISGSGGETWNVKALKQASNGSFWIGTAGQGFFEYTSDDVLYYYYFEDYPDLNYIYSIIEDDRRNIWVSTYLGVFRVTASSLDWFSTNDGLSGNEVSSLLADSWGHIWLGTFGPEKLSRYLNGRFEQISLTNGVPENHVMNMMEDSRGNIWFGLLTMGVVKYDGAVMRSYFTDDGLASNRILSMAEDKQGNLWFGTFDQGVTKYTPGLD